MLHQTVENTEGTQAMKLPENEESATDQEQGTDGEPATPQSDTKTGAADDRNYHGDELTCRASAVRHEFPRNL